MEEINKLRADQMDSLDITWEITDDDQFMCLYKMSTFTDEDCSEWISYNDMINILNESDYTRHNQELKY